MKDVLVKIGTRQELIDHYNSFVKGKSLWPSAEIGAKEGDFWVAPHKDAKVQIENSINNRSPIVSIELMKILPAKAGFSLNVEWVREICIISDYSTIVCDKMMEEMDDVARQKERLDRIKEVVRMELDADERWDRILKIMDDYKGTSFQLGPV